jgi:thiol-disulfide isomerase/thioredoxin
MKILSRRSGLVWLAGAASTLAFAALPRKLHAETLDWDDGDLTISDPPAPTKPLAFQAADGTPHSIAEFAGHGLVVNFWATWCQPCIAEMPSLEKLSRALAPEDIAVLPLSSDRTGRTAVEAFFSKHDISALPVLLDPHSEAANAWNLNGIPTTVIIDRQGRERARLEGAADWGSDAAAEAIRRLVRE